MRTRRRRSVGDPRSRGNADGTGTDHFLEGVIRRDPVDRDVLTVADISCNAHYAFPNNACAESIAKLNPDLLAFTGGQYQAKLKVKADASE